MAVTAHERVAEKTRSMETAIYAALEALDAYRETVDEVYAEQEALDQPNGPLMKRMGQFRDRANAMTKSMEDDVLTQLLFCLDRLFTVEMTERGDFI